MGSANLDLVVPVPHHPARGETVLGGDLERIPGGKGANQAVAASRLGADVVFIGRVGADSAGDILRHSLQDSGVDTSLLSVDPDTATGTALITVDPDGDNAIVVSPGANARLRPDELTEVEAVSAAIGTADVVMLQLETPIAAVEAAATVGRGTIILDPAPAPATELPPSLLAQIDVLVPNETELAALAGLIKPPESVDDIVDAARSLGVDAVVVTLGARGAIIVTADDVTTVVSPRVKAVDTTAAGDAFRAALAVSIVDGESLPAAVEFAVRVGAATVVVAGAQPSLPTRRQVSERLGS